MRSIVTLLLILFSSAASGLDETQDLLESAWPTPSGEITEIGRGVAVVFSPDLSVEGNCRFYVALGFACFDDTDWTRVLDGIRVFNTKHPDRPVRTVVLETHGTNGHGLKLQKSKKPAAERSYISVGALEQRLEAEGVRYLVLGSCNSGRLLRPAIYHSLNPKPGDKLFLPATCGIVNASPHWDPRRSFVRVIMPATSSVEMTVVGKLSELKPATRNKLRAAAAAEGWKAPREFAISDLMMQMITRDAALRLKRAEPVDEFSKTKSSAKTSERLFRRLVRHLDQMSSKSKSPTIAAR